MKYLPCSVHHPLRSEYVIPTAAAAADKIIYKLKSQTNNNNKCIISSQYWNTTSKQQRFQFFRQRVLDMSAGRKKIEKKNMVYNIIFL